ncbi:hypothetical protein BC628DRAFT_1360434 [Trametes gibbosa]|nr:hypothetical protein BC628DRAFT_1360434 [Trametes gibbosa]
MATIVDVSGKLGEYMLKGWVLTDVICSKCRKVPVMRSPSTSLVTVQFCVNCDPAPDNTAAESGSQLTRLSPAPRASGVQDVSSVSTASYSMSRSTTPPTDVSSESESLHLAPIMDTAELLRRRQQSDTASAEIGRRMLKGWAMLGDECPNLNCYGIPLVRPPKVQATVDPRKECVICGTVYIDEKDVVGRDRLVPLQDALPSATVYPLQTRLAAGASTNSQVPVDKGKRKEKVDTMLITNHGYPYTSEARATPYARLEPTVPVTRSSAFSALEVSAGSLERTLLALSTRLDSLADAPVMNPIPIGETADTIAKVSQALAQVKGVLWSENQARIS